jgi:hypothetical protein
MVECPKNRGYLFLPPRQLVPPRDLPRLAQQAIFFLNYCAPRPEEIETLGETIAVNLEPDEAKLNGWLSRERLVDESKRAILLAGFRQARQTRVVSNRCE